LFSWSVVFFRQYRTSKHILKPYAAQRDPVPPRDIFYIVIVRVPTTFPFVPLKLKDRSKQRFRSNSMAL
jgi:hypothetical protein